MLFAQHLTALFAAVAVVLAAGPAAAQGSRLDQVFSLPPEPKPLGPNEVSAETIQMIGKLLDEAPDPQGGTVYAMELEWRGLNTYAWPEERFFGSNGTVCRWLYFGQPQTLAVAEKAIACAGSDRRWQLAREPADLPAGFQVPFSENPVAIVSRPSAPSVAGPLPWPEIPPIAAPQPGLPRAQPAPSFQTRPDYRPPVQPTTPPPSWQQPNASKPPAGDDGLNDRPWLRN